MDSAHCTLANLQTVQKRNEILKNKVEKAKNQLHSLKKQCQEAKLEKEKLATEINTLQIQESELDHLVVLKRSQESTYQDKYKDCALKLDNISWKRKIIQAKHELEKSNRNYYKTLMEEFTNKIPDFMIIDEYQKKNQDKEQLETLNKRIQELQGTVIEKQKTLDRIDELFKNAQKDQIAHLEKLTRVKQNLDNINSLIQNHEEDLRILSN